MTATGIDRLGSGMTRRALLGGAAANFSIAGPGRLAARPQQGFEILGAPTGASIVLARVLASGALDAAAPGASFRLWSDPDELRAGIVAGRTRLFSTPTHVPANLANRGIPLKLLCLLGMGHLYIVTSDETISEFRDLAGKPVLGFFKNDMPDLVFRACAKMEGLDPDKDMQLSYVQTGMAAAQMLGAGRASVAILSEPAATVAIMMGRQQGHVLHRSISLQDVWVKHHGGTGIPMVGVAVHASLLDDAPEIIAALRTGLPEARAWVFAHRAEAAALADKMMQMQPQVFAMALDHFNIDVVSARATKDALVAFYQIILDLAPNALGNKLPPDDYYLDL